MDKMFDRESPIIQTLEDIDVYKLIMLFYIWSFRFYTDVRFAFTNRTKSVKLPHFIDRRQLQEEIDHAEKLVLQSVTITFMESWRIFSDDFIKYLRENVINLPTPEVCIGSDGEFFIEVSGNWFHTTLWETLILCIVNELYARNAIASSGFTEAKVMREVEERLMAKLAVLKDKPAIKINAFGTRRRPSYAVEKFAVTRSREVVPQSFVGVSNVRIARELDVEPMGTNAHELPMVEHAIRRHMGPTAVTEGPQAVLENWQDLFGSSLLIILPDAYGSRRLIDQLPRRYAVHWKGFRQDSGDPIEFGEMVIAFYQKHDVDPRGKLVIFSDSLDISKILKLYNHFKGRLKVSFGWGTNHSNDTGAYKPLSTVVKVVEAAGRPTVKLSDDVSKAVGDPDEIRITKEIHGYSSTYEGVIVH